MIAIQTSIADRKFDYYNLIGDELPTRYLHNDYTSITFYPHEKCAERVCFHFNSPLGNKPLTLRRPTENLQDYYRKLFDSYEQIDDEEEYDVQLTKIHTAISLAAIYMRIDGCTYKLEKFRDDKETIEGICKLSPTNDQFLMATLKVDSAVRQYILIDTINFSMTKDDFLNICTASSF